VRPVGDHAALIEVADNHQAQSVAQAARARYGDQLIEVVPGHATVLVVWRAGSVIDAAQLAASSNAPVLNRAETIRVRYDGADLEDAASALGISQEEMIRRHSGAEYTVAFLGFVPGFPYLIAEEPSALLSLPRLTTPRTEVPAGSVAVAAGYCGIYPRPSPGGWNLLGHTDVVLFDAAREPPALLEPGMRVRFEPV
jgi:5-oxoprolinase (ATP-hydrolysing) subunit B